MLFLYGNHNNLTLATVLSQLNVLVVHTFTFFFAKIKDTVVPVFIQIPSTEVIWCRWKYNPTLLTLALHGRSVVCFTSQPLYS
jgi:hypothetical protein